MSRRCKAAVWIAVWLPAIALAPCRTAEAQTTPPAAAAPPRPAFDPERRAIPTEPDFRVVSLPTTLRLPRHKGTFTLTHRFNGNLRTGSFLDQLGDVFGMDRGASIGLEYRYAVMRHVQAVVFRTNIDKTIQFTGKFDQIHQSDRMPVSITGLVAVEGSNNFSRRFQPSLGAVVERSVATRLAMYATPVWVHDTAAEAGLDEDTFFVGFGGRARVWDTLYVVGEISPRVTGYRPGTALYGFGVEKRVGGHVFQLNFTNAPSTTFGQVARGGYPGSLSMGFNLSRKFF